MPLKLNWLMAAVFLAAVTFAGACSGALATPIGDVTANPRDYEDRVITIAGEVSDRMSLL